MAVARPVTDPSPAIAVTSAGAFRLIVVGQVVWSGDSGQSLLAEEHPGPEPLYPLRNAVDKSREYRIDTSVWFESGARGRHYDRY